MCVKVPDQSSFSPEESVAKVVGMTSSRGGGFSSISFHWLIERMIVVGDCVWPALVMLRERFLVISLYYFHQRIFELGTDKFVVFCIRRPRRLDKPHDAAFNISSIS